MLEQPTASTAPGSATEPRISRMQAQISAQLPAVSKFCEPAMPRAAGWDHSRWATASWRPDRSKRTARQLPVPASRASR